MEAALFIDAHPTAFPHGLVTALFKPDIAVDSIGRILQLSPSDFAALVRISRDCVADTVPTPNVPPERWRIDWGNRMGNTNDHLFVASAPGEPIKHVAIYGYDARNLDLDPPTKEGLTRLPEVLDNAFGILEEGMDDFDRTKVDKRVVDLVRAAVGRQ